MSIKHNLKGFQTIIDLIKLIEIEYKETPLVIFEYTGIYHKALEKFLLAQKIKYHIISPLRSKKSRARDMRGQKTDARDCLSLSKLFYENNLGEFKFENENYSKLRRLSRYYETCLKHLIKTKVNFKEVLAVVYPNYKEIFKHSYTQISLIFLKTFPHPDVLKSMSSEEIIDTLLEKWNHRKEWIRERVKKITNYSKFVVSGCNLDDPEVKILSSYIDQIIYYQNELDNTINEMASLASNYDLFKTLLTIPGFNKNIAVRITAEIGNIVNFRNNKSLTAYAGLDPVIYQSGDKNGMHLSISRKGNSYLRKLLHLAVNCMIKIKNNQVSNNYIKKTQRFGMKPKVAYTACANQLLRIIFYLHKTGSFYNSEKKL